MLVLICRGPLGAGMEEIYQITAALKHLSFGKHVAVLTDARFSGVSTGACIGHVGPEALAGGPIGKVVDGDRIRIVIDRNRLEGTIDLVGHGDREFGPEEGARVLAGRPPAARPRARSRSPGDTRLWAALQQPAAAPGAAASTTSTRSPRCSGAGPAEALGPAAAARGPPFPRHAHGPLGQQLAGHEARAPRARSVDVPDGLSPRRRRRAPGPGRSGPAEPPRAAGGALAPLPGRLLQHHGVAPLLGVRAHPGPGGARGDHRLHDAAVDRGLRPPSRRRADHPGQARGPRPGARRHGRAPRPGGARALGRPRRRAPDAGRRRVVGDRNRADQGPALDDLDGRPDGLAARAGGRADRPGRGDPPRRLG